MDIGTAGEGSGKAAAALALAAGMLAAWAGDAAPGAPAGPHAQAAVTTPSATALMDWAELAYPSYFPGRQPDRELAPYVFRHYPATGNYLGVAAGSVYLLGPVVGSDAVPLYVGEVGAFACQVDPGPCTNTTSAVCFDQLWESWAILPFLTPTQETTYSLDGEVLQIRRLAHASQYFPSVTYRGRKLAAVQSGFKLHDGSVEVDTWRYFTREADGGFLYLAEVETRIERGDSTVTTRHVTEYDPPVRDRSAMLAPGEITTITWAGRRDTTINNVAQPAVDFRDPPITLRYVGAEDLDVAGTVLKTCRFERPLQGVVEWLWQGYGVSLKSVMTTDDRRVVRVEVAP